MVSPGQFFVLFTVGTWSTSWGELAAFVVVVVVVVYAFMFSFTSTSHSLQVITSHIILGNIYCIISYYKSYKSSDAMPTKFHTSSRKYPMGSEHETEERTNS